MKKLWLLILAVCLSAIGSTAAKDDGEDVILKTSLHGLTEVPPNNTDAAGSFVATIHPDHTIDFKLTYTDLAANPTMAHIHFGRNAVNGGVMIFLCGGGAQPQCPLTTSGTIEGTITPVNVVGPAPQGIGAGDLVAALRVIGEGQGYVNIHDQRFPGGEIRGQLKASRGNDDDN